ncbi:hypothetical protein HS7_08750 [Sulfolobales archaeon HS-7]|nr:hypothetical protein HS7_08750 [Sulfolobales archaeon HS-7]
MLHVLYALYILIVAGHYTSLNYTETPNGSYITIIDANNSVTLPLPIPFEISPNGENLTYKNVTLIAKPIHQVVINFNGRKRGMLMDVVLRTPQFRGLNSSVINASVVVFDNGLIYNATGNNFSLVLIKTDFFTNTINLDPIYYAILISLATIIVFSLSKFGIRRKSKKEDYTDRPPYWVRASTSNPLPQAANKDFITSL